MKTKIIAEKFKNEAYKKACDFIESNEISFVNFNIFFDEISDKHKAVICYYQ